MGKTGAPQPVKDHLRAAIPVGWLWKESMTLGEPEGQANVIFSSEPVEPDVDAARYAGLQKEALSREFAGYHHVAFEQMRMLGGRDGFLNRFEWQPPGSPRVTQIQIYYVEDGRGYTATATVPTENFPRWSKALTAILDNLRIDDAPSPGAGADGEEAGASPSPLALDNREGERYEQWLGDDLAGILQYRLRSSLIALIHTEIDQRFQGQGLASRLIVFALEDARKQGREVLPFCPLVASYIQGHPEWADLVPEDRRDDFGL